MGVVVAGFLAAFSATAAAIPARPAPTAIQSFTLKGHEDFPGSRGPLAHGTLEVWCQFPDKFAVREEVTYVVASGRGAGRPADIQTTVFGFNGDQVVYQGFWPGGRQTPAGYVSPTPSQEELQPLLPKARLDFATLAALLFQGAVATLVPDEVRTEIQAWAPNGPLVRVAGSLDVPHPIHGDASDYRDVDGVRVPFRVTQQIRTPDVVDVWTFDQIRWNVTINPKVFKPTGTSGR
jgi:hypothetical protein